MDLHHRPLLTALGSAAALALTLSGCSGGTGSSSPDSASEDDFCEAYTSLQDRVFADLDLSASEEEQVAKVADAVRGWAGDLAEAGTPDDIPAEAREGYEVFVDAVEELPEDFSTTDLENLENELSEEDQAAGDAFTEYAEELCGSSLGVPDDLESQLEDLSSELPSDLPSELPSDFPSDFDLEDLPPELLENLPSDFPTDALPSDFPSELLEQEQTN